MERLDCTYELSLTRQNMCMSESEEGKGRREFYISHTWDDETRQLITDLVKILALFKFCVVCELFSCLDASRWLSYTLVYPFLHQREDVHLRIIFSGKNLDTYRSRCYETRTAVCKTLLS